jgi:hypothetical protein
MNRFCSILDTQEVKTTWHPIERGQGGGWGVLTVM